MNDSKVARLEKLALRRFCQDIVKHSIQYVAQTNEEKEDTATMYHVLQIGYANEILEMMLEIFDFRFFPHPSGLPSMSSKGSKNSFWCTLQFIFNEYIRYIRLPASYFTGEIAELITRRCKDLRCFTLENDAVLTKPFVLFSSCFKNLTVLTFKNCSVINTGICIAISECLVSLKVLNLQRTEITDKGVYALCGHKLPFLDNLGRCCYTKDCVARSSLSLRSITLLHTLIDKTGIACLLTHIPTLRYIGLPASTWHKLSQIIFNIILSRMSLGMPILKFQIEHIEPYVSSVKCWEAFLYSCPNLKELNTNVPDHVYHTGNENLDKALVCCELKNLRTVSFNCSSMEKILTENFVQFWMWRGHQLTSLCLKGYSNKHLLIISCSDFRNIITWCPNLENLEVLDAVVLKTDILEDFPRLPLLKNLTLDLWGEDDFIQLFALNVIFSAWNIVQIVLKIPSVRDCFKEKVSGDTFHFLERVSIITRDNSEHTWFLYNH